MRAGNCRNGDVPPLGFTAKGAEESDESCGFACRRRRDRLSRSLTVLGAPELDPRGVQEGLDVFDAEQFLAAFHGQQIAFEVEHLDAVRAAVDDAAGEGVALAQGVFYQLALGDVVKMADDAELPARKLEALNLPVVGFETGNVLAQPGGVGRGVGLAGCQRVAKAQQHLGSHGLGPNGPHDVLEIAADQRPYAAEHIQRNGTRLAHAELRIHDVHAKGCVLDQQQESVVIAAQQFLSPLAFGDVLEAQAHAMPSRVFDAESTHFQHLPLFNEAALEPNRFAGF